MLFFALAALFGAPGPSDDELVRRATAGDRDAFSTLVLRHQDRIYALCLRWVRDPALAEEVAQDAFVSAWRALPGFRGDARFTTWMTRIAVNHCKNRRLYLARRKHDQHEPLEGEPRDDAPAREIADPRAGTDRPLHRSEAEALLHAALDQLDESHRAIVLLRDVEDLDYEEIADALDIPRGTVKSRLHRARAQLARLLGKHLTDADLTD